MDMSEKRPEPEKNGIFSPSHANRIRIGCQHLDHLLDEIERIMDEGSSNTSFPQYVPDITPAQKTCIEDYISHMRNRLSRVLDSAGIPKTSPDIPASRAVRVRLASMQISVDEMRPSAMRGYGMMTTEGETCLSGAVSELRVLIRQVEQFLSGTGGQNIKERLSKLESTSHDLDLLRTIEQRVSDYGLVEFRGQISSILDSADDQVFEIAVFGRVSSGKSSLLNAILGEDLLPVGVTPVTALPIHIRWSDKREILVTFVDKNPIVCPPEDLFLYATEQHNPSNSRHVTRIIARLPAHRLLEGVGFADTPGLGSLATSGAALTRAYLPSCDLGIVLIDAGSTLTAEDIQTVYSLQSAGIPVQILVSKGDLLSDEESRSLCEYISSQITVRCDVHYPVHLVSTRKSHRHLLDTWFESAILPLVKDARDMKTRSLQRKIGLLWEAVQHALSEEEKDPELLTPEHEQELLSIETALRNGSAHIEETRNYALHQSRNLFSDLSPLWEMMTEHVIQSMNGTDAQGEVHSLIRDDIVGYVHQENTPVQDKLIELASQLDLILEKSATLLPIPGIRDSEDLRSKIHDMPRYDPGSLNISFSLPVYSTFLGRAFLENTIRSKLKELMKKELKKSFEVYKRILVRWTEQTLGLIEKSYENTAGQYRAGITRMLKNNR